MPSRRRAAGWMAIVGAGWVGAGWVGAGLAGAPLPAAAAPPSRTVPLHQTGVIATDIGPGDCREFPADRRASDQDGWIFQAPGDAGRFRTVALRFDAPTGTVDVAVGADESDGSRWHGRLLDGGRRLWLVTPHGWTLMRGSAELAQAAATDFDLASTCWADAPLAGPATAPQSSTVDTQTTPAGTGTVPITAVVGTPSGTPTSPPPPGAGGGTGGLPVTGARLVPLVLLGLALTVAGALLRAVRRRRAAALR